MSSMVWIARCTSESAVLGLGVAVLEALGHGGVAWMTRGVALGLSVAVLEAPRDGRMAWVTRGVALGLGVVVLEAQAAQQTMSAKP